jgi:guanylate kinase
MSGILFIISSPSGGGKGTLIREVLRTVPNIGYSVSFTTRAIRDGETDGKDYFFVAQTEFEKLVKQGEFLEYANVHGNFYGTSLRQIERETAAGRDIILEIDVQGAESVHRLVPQAVRIFILPPSYSVLRERLILRRTESEAELAVRLQNAQTEVSRYKEFDYIVINDDVVKATVDLQSIIIAERLKRERQEAGVQEIIKTFENFITNSSGD